MGGTRSSSKRKSSKKSSKLSSEGRRKKRSRRTTSRKLRRRDDSSSYSGDDSSSSESILSSSSEDDYRRARSRAKTEVKGSRKRTQRSSSSRESSEDSRHAKKRKGSQRKGSKRSAKSETGKKFQKKKRRREPSVSSISGDSRSCSTCRGGSASSGEREFKTSRGRSRENSKDKGDLGKVKTGTKSNKNRSRSASPCSRYSDSGYNSKDMVPVENSLRRLRSVITVAKSPEDEKKEWEKDVHKEEIAYDHDDYPSCRSNDSNDGGSKREIAHHPFDLERKSLENAKGEEPLVSDTRMTKITQSSDEGGVEDSHRNSHSDGAGASSCRENKTQVFPTSSSANGDDLESILRLKALENLKKYRGGIQTKSKPPADEKTKIDSEVKMLSTAKAEFVRNNSNKEDDSRVLGANKVLDQNPRPTIRRDSSFPAASYVKVREGKGSVTESGRARRSVVRQPSLEAISGNPKEDPSPADAVTSKSELGKSARREESSDTILNQTQKENMLVTESDVDKSSAETSKSVGQTGGNNGRVDNVAESATSEPSSSLKPTLEEQTLKDQQGGQFEQKTMSVMRGGEMVEVSYKVYIPKKAPALARRQLRR